MAYEQPVHNITSMKAAADLSAASAQFRAVKVTADQTVNLSGAGEFSVGILQSLPEQNEAAEIMGLGLSKAVIGANGVSAGDRLQSDANGGLVVASSGGYVLAVALEDAAATVLGSVLLIPSAVPLA